MYSWEEYIIGQGEIGGRELGLILEAVLEWLAGRAAPMIAL